MSRVAMTIDTNVCYPSAGDGSPAGPPPEYPFATGQSSEPNPAYDLVRRCLREFGCDAPRWDSASWNPLGEWIKPGQRVLVLPNFVMHRRPDETIEQLHGKCTHGSVVRAALDYAVIAARDPSLVSFGSAPIQACDFRQVTEETCAEAVAEFYQRLGHIGIGPHDLRLLVSRWTRFGALVETRRRDAANAVEVDLGRSSLLDKFFPTSGASSEVRVGDYSPAETMSFHGPGRHVYVLHRRALESDVILSVPKLKTHEKVGLTCALKGSVGTIARKECLAHHRPGAPERGGDEYPTRSPLRDLASYLNDHAAGRGSDIISNTLRVGSKLLSRGLRAGPRGIMGGGWHGNDTAWRMALDIARVLRFARTDGTMAPTPQRQHLVVVDGIVAGEGEGPLRPSPRHVGAVLFAPDPCAADLGCALLAGFDPGKIPLVAESFALGEFPLTNTRRQDVRIVVNGVETDEAHFASRNGLELSLVPPKGWRGWIERHGDRAVAV